MWVWKPDDRKETFLREVCSAALQFILEWFVHVPKNAGTSILNYFNSTPESILPDQSWKEYSLFYDEWKYYTSFSIVRNPYSRFESFYKFLRIGSNINNFAKIDRHRAV